MEMRAVKIKQIQNKERGINADNILGYIFMAQQNNKNILIEENEQNQLCKAKYFWDTIGISVMDIEIENDRFKKCDYINEILILEYGKRIIKIKIVK